MATIIDPNTGKPIEHCVSCGAETLNEGITCPNAQDLCIDCCGENHGQNAASTLNAIIDGMVETSGEGEDPANADIDALIEYIERLKEWRDSAFPEAAGGQD